MSSPIEFDSKIQAATDFVRGHWSRSPRFGIILGTGAGKLAEEIASEIKIPYEDIPGFPQSTALGHKGQLVCGKLADQDVIAMEGRFHLYEGYPVNQATLAIHVMQRMGVEVLFVSNASGGINPKFASGEIMLIESHVDFMYRSSLEMNSPTVSGRPGQLSDAYDRELIEQASSCARQEQFPLHRGVYAGLLGPNYETRAEYRFLRRIGADVVGMSTIPEVTVAGRHGMRVLGMSIITNVAKPDILEATSGQEVIDAAVLAAPHLKAIVVNAIQLNQ
ncbi:MAG: purine-nucleoside phosphorylase [Mariniblastus sp.]|nr:purine-nucleoside phosphorylase [Mariniblastus sp.]